MRGPANHFEYEGKVLYRGVLKACERTHITATEFLARAQLNRTGLYRAFRGNAPLYFYAHMWLFIAALYNGEWQVILYRDEVPDDGADADRAD